MRSLLLEGSSSSSIIMLVVLGVLIVLMLVLPSIGQKKRITAYQEMQSKLKAGDKVQTVGGIIGRIVKITENEGIKTMILETGEKNSKTTMEFNLDAIAGVVQKPEENTAVATASTPEQPEAEEAEKAEEVDEVVKTQTQPKATQNKSNKNKKK